MLSYRTFQRLYDGDYEWILEEYTIHHTIKIKNFFGGKKLNWKVLK